MSERFQKGAHRIQPFGTVGPPAIYTKGANHRPREVRLLPQVQGAAREAMVQHTRPMRSVQTRLKGDSRASNDAHLRHLRARSLRVRDHLHIFPHPQLHLPVRRGCRPGSVLHRPGCGDLARREDRSLAHKTDQVRRRFLQG